MTPPLPSGPGDLIPVGPTTLVGTVTEFDEPRGIGRRALRRPDRLVPLLRHHRRDPRPSRSGTLVAVRIGPARLGRLEARSVHPLPGVHPGGMATTDVAQRGIPRAVTHGPSPVRRRPSLGAQSPAALRLRPGVLRLPVDRSGARIAVRSGSAGRTGGPGRHHPLKQRRSRWNPNLHPLRRARAVPSSWSPGSAATPVSGTPVVGDPPASGTGIGPPTPGGAASSDEDDESSPKPDFWSPFSRIAGRAAADLVDAGHPEGATLRRRS